MVRLKKIAISVPVLTAVVLTMSARGSEPVEKKNVNLGETESKIKEYVTWTNLNLKPAVLKGLMMMCATPPV